MHSQFATFKIIIQNSFACVCVFEALFIHRYMYREAIGIEGYGMIS